MSLIEETKDELCIQKELLVSLNLLENVATSGQGKIRFFGKVKLENKKYTAEFICYCGNTFRDTLENAKKRKVCKCSQKKE